MVLTDSEDSGEVFAFGKLHRVGSHKMEYQGGLTWDLPQQKLKQILDKSIAKYLNGDLSKEEGAQEQFASFEGFIQQVPLRIPFNNGV